MLNGAYHLDLAPKGHGESRLSHPQAWVRHHEKYDG